MNTIRNKKDLYEGDKRIGFVITTYQVDVIEEFDEMSFLMSAEQENLKFLLSISQRVIYYNQDSVLLTLTSNENKFLNYPVLLDAQIALKAKKGVVVSVLDYSPKIINTEVSKTESSSNAEGKTINSSISSTTGSSSSISVSTGISSSTGINIDLTGTNSWESSKTKNLDAGSSSNAERSTGISMAVEDWGAYASINTLVNSPIGVTWNFGQQNPWNALIYHKFSGVSEDDIEKHQLVLPQYVVSKLFDQGTTLPPSGLSLYGFDFLMEASFLVKVSDPYVESLEIEHVIKVVKASHMLQNGKVEVSRDKTATFLTNKHKDLKHTVKITPVLLALKPIGQVFSSAIVGFHRNSFDLLPSSSSGFRIRSLENDMLVRSKEVKSDQEIFLFSVIKNALCIDLKQDEASFEVFFKIADSHKNYNIVVKHWLQKELTALQHPGVELHFIINGDLDSKIIKYVNDSLQDGGESNVLSFSLRNLDYASIDFHNYLRIGLNKITILVKKPKDCDGIKYMINAISIVSST